MRKTNLMVAACATLLWAVATLATPGPQQKCDTARITAWKVYTSCVDTVVAKEAKGVSIDEFAAFAKCQHTYFKKWTAFQSNASLATSTCIGTRFTSTDSGTTVTDGLTGLVWEKKTGTPGGFVDCSTTTCPDPHDVSNFYTWSSTPVTTKEDGTAFTSFLAGAGTGLNTAGFAGANGWRLPTLAELQTIVLDFVCSGVGGGATCQCGSNPCVDGTFGPTQSNDGYWSATSNVRFPLYAWIGAFNNGGVNGFNPKTSNDYVRAVRGGL